MQVNFKNLLKITHNEMKQEGDLKVKYIKLYAVNHIRNNTV